MNGAGNPLVSYKTKESLHNKVAKPSGLTLRWSSLTFMDKASDKSITIINEAPLYRRNKIKR